MNLQKVIASAQVSKSIPPPDEAVYEVAPFDGSNEIGADDEEAYDEDELMIKHFDAAWDLLQKCMEVMGFLSQSDYVTHFDRKSMGQLAEEIHGFFATVESEVAASEK